MIEIKKDLPESLKLRLHKLEEELRGGLLTEVAFEKRSLNLLKPYVRPNTMATKLSTLDLAVVEKLTQASDDEDASALGTFKKDVSDDSLYAETQNSQQNEEIPIGTTIQPSWQDLRQESVWALGNVLKTLVVQDEKVSKALQLPFVASYQTYSFDSQILTDKSLYSPLPGKSSTHEIAYIQALMKIKSDPNEIAKSNRYPTLIHALKDRTENTPKKVAFSSVNSKGKEVRSITYRELYKNANRLAHFFEDRMKLPKHSKVVLFFQEKDTIDCIIHLYGCMIAGMQPIVTFSTSCYDVSPGFIQSMLNDSDVKAIFVSKGTRKFFENYSPFSSQISNDSRIFLFNYRGKKKDYPIVATGDTIAYSFWPCEEMNVATIPIQSSAATSIVRGNKIPARISMIENFKAKKQPLVSFDHATLMRQCSILAELYGWKEVSPTINYSCLDSPLGWLFTVFLPVCCGFSSILMSRSGFLMEPMSLPNTISRYGGASCMLNTLDSTRLISSLQPESTSTSRIRDLVDLVKLQRIFLVMSEITFQSCHHLAQSLSSVGFRGTCTALICSEETGLIIATHSICDGAFSTINLNASDVQRNFVRPILEDEEKSSKQMKTKDHLNGLASITVNGFAPIKSLNILLVKPESNVVCYTDEIGEFWFQQDEMNSSDRHIMIDYSEQPILPCIHNQVSLEGAYVRTGIVGFTHSGMIYPLGKLNSQMKLYSITKECYVHLFSENVMLSLKSTLNDINEILVLKQSFFNEDVMLILIEMRVSYKKPEALIAAANNLLKQVQSYIKERFQINPYAIAIVPPHQLPRNKENRINALACRGDFFRGDLEIIIAHIDSYNSLAKLPRIVLPFETEQNRLSNAAMMIQSSMNAPVFEFSGENFQVDFRDEATGKVISDFRTLPEILAFRSEKSDKCSAFLSLNENGKLKKTFTFSTFFAKVARLATFLTEKGISSGSIVTLVYRPGIQLLLAIYACLHAGIIFACAPFPDEEIDLDNLVFILEHSRSSAILGDRRTMKKLKSKQVLVHLDKKHSSCHLLVLCNDSKLFETERISIKSKSNVQMCSDLDSPDRFCMLEYYEGEEGMSPGVMLGHDTLLARCRQQRDAHQLGIKRPLLASIRPYSGLDLIYSSFLGIYIGCPTLIFDLASTGCYNLDPKVWVQVISAHHVSHVMASFNLLEACSQFADRLQRDEKHALKHVQSMIIPYGHRSRMDRLQIYLRKLNHHLGLSNDSVEFYYGSLVNPCISMRGLMVRAPEVLQTSLYDLMEERVVLKNESSRYHVSLMDSGQVTPATRIAIISRATQTTVQDNSIGEIWVRSEANGKGFHRPSKENEFIFNGVARNFPKCIYARTGDIGFVMPDSSSTRLGNKTPSHFVYVLGRTNDILSTRGFTHFNFDLERSIESCHLTIPERGAMVLYREPKLNVIVEISDIQSAPRVYPLIVTSLLEFHRVIVDRVCFVKPKTLDRTRDGGKSRLKIETSFFEHGNVEVLMEILTDRLEASQ